MKSTGGPASTLLLTAPLLVVPTLAALGLPGSADAPDDGLTLAGPGMDEPPDLGTAVADLAFPAGDGWSGGAFAATDLDDADLFGDVNPSDPPQDAATPATPTQWAGVEAEPAAPVQTLTVAAEVPQVQSETEVTTSRDPRELAETLRGLGAVRLTLEPPASGREAFFFACTLPADAAGADADRRFEAEGDTPEAALAGVLAQVRDFTTAGGGLPVGGVALAQPTP